MRSLLLKAIWMWVGFVVLAVLNGILRDTLYKPQWGPVWGYIAGTLILLVVIAIAMYAFLRRNRASLTRPRLVLLGVLWLLLSLFFEFAVSHWVMEEAWNAILTHYNVMEGQLRVLVRLLELAGPIVLGGRLVPQPAAPATAAQPEPVAPASPETSA